MEEAGRARVEFTTRDIAEIALGTCAIAFPLAVTQEVWDLGAELSLMRAGVLATASVVGLALVVGALHHGSLRSSDRKVYLQRLAGTYGIALLISALLLVAIGRFDLLGAPLVGLKRAILVTFPACFAATGIDSIASPGGPAVGES